MKIEDILRVAYNKTLKAPGTSMTWSKHSEEELNMWIESDLKSILFENIFRLAYKRRPSECFPIGESYLEALMHDFIEAGIRVIENKPSYSWQKREFHVQFNNYSACRVLYDSGVISFFPGNRRVDIIKAIPISDLIKYFIGVDELLRDLPNLVDKIRKEGQKLGKSQDIIYKSASSIIKNIELPEGVSIQFYLNDFYLRDCRILCILTQNDYPFPPYHKTCRSELGTLKEDIVKTIKLLTQYKFRGYVED